MKDRATILDDIPDDSDERASRKLARMRGQLDELRRELRATEQERDDAEKIAAAALAIQKARAIKPITIKPAKGQRRAEAWLVLSDHHYGKLITEEEVGGVNSYTPEVAAERLRSLGEGFRWQIESWRGNPGYQITRINLAILGDMPENTLHEENHATNTMSPPEEVSFADEHLGRLVGEVLSIGIPTRAIGIPGNHGRTTRKQPSQGRSRYSYETVIYRALAKRYPKIEWIIPAAAEVIVTSAGHDLRCIHGDQIRAGNAAGGPAATISRGVMKMDSERRCHSTVMGHWHQFLFSQRPGYIVNNSLCGYDGYAKNMLLAPSSPPAQVAFLVDERDGVVMPKQIRVYDSEQRRRDAAKR